MTVNTAYVCWNGCELLLLRQLQLLGCPGLCTDMLTNHKSLSSAFPCRNSKHTIWCYTCSRAVTLMLIHSVTQYSFPLRVPPKPTGTGYVQSFVVFRYTNNHHHPTQTALPCCLINVTHISISRISYSFNFERNVTKRGRNMERRWERNTVEPKFELKSSRPSSRGRV